MCINCTIKKFASKTQRLEECEKKTIAVDFLLIYKTTTFGSGTLKGSTVVLIL